MGKNRVIKSLGKNIGNLVVHKILAKYTNNPEAIEHLRHEIIAYRENTKEIAESYNWNDSEIAEIKLEAIAEIKLEAIAELEKEMHRDYSDVNFPMEEAEKFIEEILKEIME